MFEYKKIVYAINVNDRALENKIEEVCTYAQQKKAMLFIVMVHKTVFDYGYGASVNAKSPNEMLKEKVSEKLKALEAQHTADENQQFLLIEADAVADGIVEFVKEKDVDLLVLNGHHHGILGRMGSVATKIANNTPCDIVILKNA